MGVGRLVKNPITADQRAIANGIATLDASAKVPKNQISLTAGDVGAVGTETDPTVAAFTKALTSSNAVLSAVNAASGTVSADRLGNELSAIQSLADTTGFLKKIGDGVYSIDPASYLQVTGGVATISSAQQFTGFVLSNGATTVAQLIGTSPNNDIGAIVLRSAESANVVLSASGNSYINGGNFGIGISNPSSLLEVNGSVKFVNSILTATTPSTSPTTGASIVAGGQGVGGDQHIAGFTSLGGTSDGHLAIKIKILEGTTASTQGGQTFISHGINSLKLISASLVINHTSSDFVPSSYTQIAGYQADIYISAGGITVLNSTTNSSFILSKPFILTVLYRK